MPDSSETELPATPGRRRDPSIGPRALEAALSLYAREGWVGFTFDAVAKEGGFGKPALYRRWDSPAKLLIDAFELLELPTPRDCGSLEEDLRYYARQFVEWSADPRNMMIANRLAVDREINRELAEAYDSTVYLPRYEAVKALNARAKERGEVTDARVSLIAVEMLLGATMVRYSFGEKIDTADAKRKRISYLDHVIDVTMAGLRAQSAVTEPASPVSA